MLQTTTTGRERGAYLFSGLVAGTYTVTVTDLNGVLTGYTHTVGAESLVNPTGAIVVGPTDIYRDADFGYRRVPTTGTAVIGGHGMVGHQPERRARSGRVGDCGRDGGVEEPGGGR